MEPLLRSKNVFITGAAGFIGSHTVEAFVRSGANVKALVQYNSGSNIENLQFLEKSVLDQVEIVFGDIRDSEQMVTYSKGSDIILHLAALIGIPYSYVAPRSYVETNITGTLNILEAAKRWDVSRIVCTSTSETYGTALYTPIDEEHPMQGQSPYSASKIGADKMAESYFRSFGTPVTVLRPFNTYGPRQSMRAVTPTIITQALESDEIRLGSLSPVRDLLYVKDTALSFVSVITSPKTIGEVVQVGTGDSVTIGDLVKRVQKICGTNKEVIEESGRVRPEKSEVMTLICNPKKAKERMGWEPQFSLEDGLRQTVEWIDQNRSVFLEKSRYAI